MNKTLSRCNSTITRVASSSHSATRFSSAVNLIKSSFLKGDLPNLASITARRTLRAAPEVALRGMAAILAICALFGFNPQALAASATWTGVTDGTWAGANWSTSPVPGTGDTATFNGAGNSNTTIDLGSGVTVGNILFDTSGVAAYTIGNGGVGAQTLTFSDDGSITMNPTVASNELFNAGIILGTDATTGTDTFTNNSLTNTLDFAGNIAGGTGGTAGVQTLAIGGAGNTVFSGNLNKGGATNINLTKIGTGTFTVNPTSNVGSASGTVAVNEGTLAIDFSNAGANNSLLSSFSPLALGGGTLQIIGNASNASTQTFGGLTANPGLNVITTSTNSAAGSSDPAPTLTLGAITQTLGSQTVYNGPAYDSNATGAAAVLVPATGTITTTTLGIKNKLLWQANNAAVSTVGLYNWASVNTSGASNSILSGDQVSGFYVTVTAGGSAASNDTNYDLLGSATGAKVGGNGTFKTDTYMDTIRFNVAGAYTFTTGPTGTNAITEVGGILVTPNVGANNTTLANGGTYLSPGNGGGTVGLDVYQNNAAGELAINVPFYNAWNGSNFTTDVGSYVQGGPGTVVLMGQSTNDGQTGSTYLNGGTTVINDNSQLGIVSSNKTLNLNGGTVLGSAASLSLGTRAVTLGGDGGGLAAVTGDTMTVGGVISGAAETGPLVIGIPASAANGNVAGLLPGTGAGTANTTGTNATGTVILTNAGNTYTGGTVVDTGTLRLGVNNTAALGTGGLTLNGGAFQWATTAGVNTDISGHAIGFNNVSGNTIDVDGQSVTFANGIGNNTPGGFTLISTVPGGGLTLNGANTYTGTTTVGSGTLTLGGSLIGNVSNGATFTEGSGGVISGAGVTFTNTAGTATLGGANTYTGATSVSGGTLNLTGGTIAGNVSNAATFTENSTGVINGSGATFTNTAGTATLGGANTYGGGTTISGGTVNVTNGSGSGTGSAGVALNGGTLAGNGSISGTVTVGGGTLAPGAAGTILTMGGLTFNSGTLSFTLNGAGAGALANSAISVPVGTATFNAKPTLSVSAINVTSITNNEVFTILASGNTIGGSNNLTGLPTITVGRYVLTPSDTGDDLILTAVGSAANLVWAGGVGGLSTTVAPQGDGSTWNNTQTTSPAASNWNNGGKYDYFYDFDTVTFNDTGSPSHTVSLTTANSPASVTVNTSSAYTFNGSGSITGPGAVTVQTGKLNLNTVNTYSGGTVLEGNITAGVANALPSTGTVALSGTLDINGYNQSIGNLSDGGVSTGIITNGGSSLATLTTTGTGSSTYSGLIQDGAHATALSVAYAANTLTLSGANTYGGGTTLTNGTLLINNGSAGASTSSAIGTGTLTINGGSINTSLSGLTLGTNNAITIGGSFTFGGSNNMNLGTGAVSITGSPTIALNGSGTALTLGGAVSFTSNASASATVNGAGNTLNLGGLALNSGAGIVTDTLGGSANINISGAVTNGGAGANGLTYAGTGALTLAGGDTQTGAITLSSGTLNLTGGTVNGPASLTVANGAILNIAGASVTLPSASGSPALNFAVGNSNPEVFISSGSLTYGLNAAGDQNQAMQAGTFTQTGGTVSTDESLMAGPAGQTYTFYLGGTGSYSSGVGEYANFTVGTRGIANAYVDGGTLTVSGGNANPAVGYGDQLLVGAQYSGGTAGTREFVQQGGSVVTNGLSLGGFSAAAVNSPGVYYLNGGTLNTGALNRGYDTNANEGTGTLNFGGGTFEGTSTFATDSHVVTNINSGGATIDVPVGDDVTWSGGISAGTTGNVTGATLSNAGSGYTADPTVTVSGGGTGATAAAIINAAGQVTDVIITNPGSGYTSTPSFTFSAAPAGGVTATASGGTFATGNGGLTKIDAGTLTLNGANTYTGATNVNAGTLAFGSASSSASPLFNLAGGATLDVSALSSGWSIGSGVTLANTASSSATSTVNGTVVLNNGGTISAGTAGTVGSTMDIGSLTLNSAGGNVLYSITDPTTTTGFSSLIDVTTSGALTINGGQIGITGATFNTGTSYNITYDLFQYTGSIAGAGLSTLSVNPAEELNGLNYLFGTSGGFVTLTISGAPTLISNWITDGNGSWAASGNWDNGVPNLVGDTAKFGGAAATDVNLSRTVQLNGNETVGEIDFSSPNGESYTITQGSSGNLTLNNNGSASAVIAYTGTHAIDSTVPVDLSSNLTVGSSNITDNLTIAGVIANTNTGTLAATLTKTGPGVLVLSNANTYGPSSAGTVGTNLNGGTLQVGNNASLGSGDLSFGASATLQAGAPGLVLANNVVIASGGLTATVDTNGNTLGLTGVISDIGGAGALTVASTTAGGTLVLTNAETYGGATTINSGATLQIGNGSTNGSLASTAAITDNGALAYEGASSGTVTVSNNIGGSGSLTQASVAGNVLTLSGSNTYSGVTTVSGGSLVLANNYAVQKSVLNLSGGGASFSTPTAAFMVGLEGSQNLSLTNTGSSAAVALSLSGAGSYVYTGNLSGLGSVTMNGTGSVQIGNASGVGAANYAGGTTVNSGSVTISGTGTQAGPATLSAGTLILTGTSTVTGAVTLAGNGASTFTVEDSADVDSDSPLDLDTVNNGYATGITATLENNASVTVAGFSWGTGIDRVQSGNSLTIENSASLIDNGSFNFLNTDGGTGSQALITYNLSGSSTLAAQNFILSNYGSGTGTSQVTLDLNGGTIEALASDGANSSTLFLPALTRLTANVQAGGVTVNTNGFNVTIGQALVHNGSGTDGGLTVEGSGTLTLTANSNYTGPTKVTAGTLIIGGSISATSTANVTGGNLEVDGVLNGASAATVNGELSGDGDVDGGVDAVGGTIAPGLTIGSTAVGILTSAGSVSLDNASTLSFRLGLAGITDADQLDITNSGTLTLNDSLLNIIVGSGASTLSAIGTTYTLVSGGAGSTTGTTTDSFANAPFDGTNYVYTNAQGFAFDVLYGQDNTNTNIEVTLVAVPEPSTWGSLLAGMGLLCVWQRRRKSRA